MYIKRKILDYLKNTLKKEPAIILIGTRQVGKTTLIKKMEDDLRKESKSTLYFNLELPSSLELFSAGVEGFLEYLKAQGISLNSSFSEYIYIFIDEFQYINNAGKFLKALIDNFQQIKIVASGSSSVEIQKSLKESLVGRKRIINIYSLDFLEFLYFNQIKEAEYFENIKINQALSPALCSIFAQLFSQFLVWGGMPKVILEQDWQERRVLLEEISSSYLQKDIKGLIGSENLAAFNKLMILLAAESSSIMNLHSLSNILNLSRKELERHFFILDNTFVNYLISPFYANKRKELSKTKKSIFYDNGIGNYLLKNLSDFNNRMDKGRLLESAVYNEMRKNLISGMQIYYWRTQHQTEIDFVLGWDGKMIPLEVKAGPMRKLPHSLASFAHIYNCPFGIVVNNDNWQETVIGGLKVYFIPAFLSSFIPSWIVNKGYENTIR
ncbi:MAG: ATP-binding protein [Candidatus Omnitrophota bacterium]|nr:ATP-binding protein [Candidatus Omnitrophota bacterium]